MLSPKLKSAAAILALMVLAMPVAYAANTFASLVIGGGYGFSGVTISDTGNISMDGDLVVDGTITGTLSLTGTQSFDAVNFGGGPGSTGGALEADGDIVADGGMALGGAAVIAGATTVGGGYGSTGSTFSTAGDISANGAGVFDTTLSVGGGYGATGLTVSSAGNVSADGNGIFGGTLAVTGNSTQTSIDVGGGDGSTGLTLSSTGNLGMDGNATIDGTLSVAGGFGSTGFSVASDGGFFSDTDGYIGDGLTVVGTCAVGNTFAVTANSILQSVDIGGGYGSTGATASSAGNLSINGDFIVDGSSTHTGVATFTTFTGTSTPYLLGGNATSNTRLRINGAAGTTRGLELHTAQVLRWQIGESSTAESGANSGSNFGLAAYDDSGAFIDSPISIVRAAGGAMTLPRPISATSTLAVDGDTTLGNASTDTITATGRFLIRSVTDAGPMTATAGTQRELVYNTSNSKVYVCTVTGSPATWSALN